MKLLDYMFLCHKRPDRSFFFRGRQFPLCARCTGIMCGYAVGIGMAIANLRLGFYYLPLFLPMMLDGGGQLYGYWESTNLRRLITGILTGIGIIYFFHTAITVVYPFGREVGFRLIGGVT